MALLRFESVSFRYPDAETNALEALSFSIEKGEYVVVCGESGCGKTTLLTTVAGLLKPAAGTLTWTDAAGAPVSQVRSSFVWQNLGLFPWKTVEGNLRLPFELKNSPVSATEGALRASAMIEELGLTGLEKRWPSELSGGQRQRLALGRALIAEPDVLFMDEPFSALDALRRERLQDFLAGMRVTRPVTMIFVTHDIAEAVFLASHVLLLAANPPRVLELCENPAFNRQIQCADRESNTFFDAVRHVHATLRNAGGNSQSTTPD